MSAVTACPVPCTSSTPATRVPTTMTRAAWGPDAAEQVPWYRVLAGSGRPGEVYRAHPARYLALAGGRGGVVPGTAAGWYLVPAGEEVGGEIVLRVLTAPSSCPRPRPSKLRLARARVLVILRGGESDSYLSRSGTVRSSLRWQKVTPSRRVAART